jgi:hypothetical protein
VDRRSTVSLPVDPGPSPPCRRRKTTANAASIPPMTSFAFRLMIAPRTSRPIPTPGPGRDVSHRGRPADIHVARPPASPSNLSRRIVRALRSRVRTVSTGTPCRSAMRAGPRSSKYRRRTTLRYGSSRDSVARTTRSDASARATRSAGSAGAGVGRGAASRRVRRRSPRRRFAARRRRTVPSHARGCRGAGRPRDRSQASCSRSSAVASSTRARAIRRTQVRWTRRDSSS